MQRIQDPDALATLPGLPTLAGVVGYFTNGNPASGVPATPVPDWWLNMTQEELIAPLNEAGLPLDGTHSVLSALQKLFLPTASLTNPGYIKIPTAGGQPLIIQWVRNLVTEVVAGSGGGASVEFNFPVPFTSAVLGYSYVLDNEAAAYNNWTIVAGAPSLTAQGCSMLAPGAAAGQQIAMSGFVLGF